MTAPIRIQRKRTKGWRVPKGAIYVGRPTRWGNPYRAGATVLGRSIRDPHEIVVRDAAHAVSLYRNDFLHHQQRSADLVAELRGHDLVCWCPLDQPCHADVLLELANA